MTLDSPTYMAFLSSLWRASSTEPDMPRFLEAAAAGLSEHHPGLCGLRAWLLPDDHVRDVRSAAAGLIDAWSVDCGTPLVSDLQRAADGQRTQPLKQLPTALVRCLSRHRYLDRVLVVPLRDADGPIGVLSVTMLDDDAADAATLQIASALAEPTAAAARHERRIQAMERLREAAEAERNALLTRLNRASSTAEIVGADSGLRLVMKRVEQVAPTDAPVLLLGETGSGKEVIARHLHTRSRRHDAPMVRVNCGAIPSELIDSELFGHERGAFTGATGVRQGWFERADGGTLLLDEVGELPAAAQVRLLRVLQDGVITRVGAAEDREVSVRVVAATHRNLEDMVAAGTFREDLWYRLSVFPIRIPALRERPQDIADLARFFAVRSAGRVGFPPIVPSQENIQRLASYAWPGNARELAAVIERAVILGEGHMLDVDNALGVGEGERTPHVQLGPATPAPTDSAPEIVTLDEAMRIHIRRAIDAAAGRIEGDGGAADLLAIHPSTLRSRMKKLGLRG